MNDSAWGANRVEADSFCLGSSDFTKALLFW